MNLGKMTVMGVIIAVVFTVTLSESLQNAEGLSGVAGPVEFNLQRGETAIQTWEIVNDGREKTWIEFYTSGEGGDLILFEKILPIEAHQSAIHEFIVTIPKDHPDNIVFKPTIHALKRGDPIDDGTAGSSVSINVQLLKTAIISIGDNPIFTPPKIEEKIIPPPAPVIPEKEAAKEAKETLAEKMARIQATNEDIVQIDETAAPVEKSTETQAVMDVDPEPTEEKECRAGTVMENGICKVVSNDNSDDGGGCLIATATFGSELAPQVQFLREIRDNTLLSTASGISFMTGFNQFYYSFSPVIADLERDSPIFKETVKLVLTPMLSTLSIMTLADEGSESQVLGLGISVIVLNLAMYVASPSVAGFVIIKRIRK